MLHNHAHRRKHFKKTTQLSISRLIFAIGLAGVDTVWSLYMNSFELADSTIGFVSAFLVIVSLIASFYSTPILEKVNEYKMIILSLVILIISYLLISIFNNLYVFIGLSIIIVIANIFRLESFDIFFRDEAKDTELNEDEGLLYALLNVGWLIGPLVAGFILVTYGISSVFTLSAVFLAMGLFILLVLDMKSKKKKREKIDGDIRNNLMAYVKKKNLRIPYIISAGVEIWWSLVYIYTPLFIINAGLGEHVVGIFLALVVLPLALFEFEIGKLSEKYGFRQFFTLGFLLIGLLSIGAYYIDNIYVVLALLVIASIPMSLIEPLQDSYFFRQLRKSSDEEKFYPIYSTATDIGSFIGKFSIAGFLLYFTQESTYLVIAFFMMIVGLISLKVKE